MPHEKELAVKLYSDLLLHRMMEEEIIEQYKLGKVPGHIHSGVGEEAAFVGTFATRREGDYFKLSHRNISSSCLLGVSLNTIFSEIMGKASGNSGGRGGINHISELSKGMLGFSGTLGCDIPVAVGAALSLDYFEKDNLVYVYLGDGTFSRGPVHEALNLAAVWKLPVLFVCENNQFAISTPLHQQSPVKNPAADRAPAYGMPAKIADGTDVFSVYDAASELADWVRAKNGPAILEVQSYRWRGHFEGDQAAYRDPEVTEQWRRKDSLKTMEGYLRDNGLMTDGEMQALRERFENQIRVAVEFADASPATSPEDIFEYLYV